MNRLTPCLLVLVLLSSVASADEGDYVTVDPQSSYPTSKDEQDAPVTPTPGTPVYPAADCIGAVVNGVCHGSVIPEGVPKRCYGQMLNGQCTGPQF